MTSSKDGCRERLTSAEFISLFKEVSTRPEIYFLLMRSALCCSLQNHLMNIHIFFLMPFIVKFCFENILLCCSINGRIGLQYLLFMIYGAVCIRYFQFAVSREVKLVAGVISVQPSGTVYRKGVFSSPGWASSTTGQTLSVCVFVWVLTSASK